MTSILKPNYILLVLSLFCAFFFPLLLQAQSSLALSITPTIINIGAEPGSTWSSSIKVINSNNFDITVYTSVVNFEPSGEEGQGIFVPVDTEDSTKATLAEWVTLPQTSVTIKPQSSSEVSFVVTVPDTAEPGSHFAALLIGTQPPKTEDGSSSVQTSQIVSSLFFLNVDGDIVEEGLIRSFVVSNSYSSSPTSDFELRFENRGNVHLQPRGEIIIKNMWGSERGRIPVNLHTSFGNALPQTIRKYNFSWSGPLSFGDIGLYKASVDLTYGTEAKQFASAVAYFWVLPLKAFLFSILIIGGVILFVTWAVRSYIRRMFMLAGINPHTLTPVGPYASHNGIKAHTRDLDIRNISAPVRVGVLDFASVVKQAHSVPALLKQLSAFIKNYPRFFVGFLGTILICICIIWFVKSITSESKEYSVMIGNDGNSTSYNSEELMYRRLVDTVASTSDQSLANSYSVSLINTSGVAGVAGEAAARLYQDFIPVTALSFDTERIDERTVIIFPAALQAEALRVSEVLGGGLLSATDAHTTDIIVFVGKDQIR